jgi:CRISPR-associated protein Cmr1
MERICIETLTPLWTGDIEGECSKIKETSIIGSLRWWYEVLVRGLGGGACDPTSDDKCELNHKEFRKMLESKSMQDALDKLICPACQLFGCTGWSRKFRLEIRNGKPVYDRSLIIRVNRNRGWYLGSGLHGSLEAAIVALKNEDQNTVLPLLRFVSEWGGIGARTQQGYGIFRIISVKDIKIPKIDELVRSVGDTKNENVGFEQRHLPNIKDFFFCKIQLNDIDIDNIGRKATFEINREFRDWICKKSKDFVPTAPLVRYYLRRLQLFGNRDLRHFLMGFMATGKHADEKIGSKIHVSHVYKVSNGWEMRIWGWIPEFVTMRNNRKKIELFKNRFGKEREDVLKILNKRMKIELEEIFGTGSVSWQKWKEFNSPRDSKGAISNVEYFIKSLGDSQ